MPASPARQQAYEILLRVERDNSYSSELLHAGQPQLDPRDQALATEIALGTLRRQGEIDDLIARAGKRPVPRLDPEVRTALRIGCYQLRFLDRIPSRAAVSESVELVKAARKKSAAGFVNAVLRNLPPSPPAAEKENYPGWLVERWTKNFGPELALKILEAGLQTPATYIRLNTNFDLRETKRLLTVQGAETETTEFPTALKLTRGRVSPDPENRYRIQDIGSQAVVPLLELAPGLSVLDLCAAPGGKTFHALETTQNIIAADRHAHRLRIMRELANVPLNLVALDARRPLPFRKTFDRILVDAPCSGTGTLARNPEIKWRLNQEDILDLAARQRAILSSALSQLGPEGLLVYATCSLEPEENQQVVDHVLKEKPSFQAGAYFQRIPGRDAGDGFYACQVRRK